MPVTEYLSAVVKPLLNHPDALTVSQTQDAMGVLLSITVHKEDMGLLIGTKGETAKAVRHLVRIVGVTNKQRVAIRINEPDGTPYQRK